MEPERTQFFSECIEDAASSIAPCIGCNYELRSIDGHIHPFLFKDEELFVNFNDLLKEGDNLSHLRLSPSNERIAFISENENGFQTLYNLRLVETSYPSMTISRVSISTIEFGGNDLYMVMRDPSLHPISIAAVIDGSQREVFKVPAEVLSIELSPSNKDGVLALLKGSPNSSYWVSPRGAERILSSIESTFKLVDTDTRRFILEKPGESGSELFLCSNNCTVKTSLLKGSKDLILTDIENKGTSLIIFGRRNGREILKLLTASLSLFELEFGEEGGEARVLRSYPALHLLYSSLRTPQTIFKVDENSGRLGEIWRESVQRFNSSDYKVTTHSVSQDTDVSYSIVQRNDAESPPLVLTAYGAYGAPASRKFVREFLPLLRRGIAFGVSHIRGGGDYGVRWHHEGRGINKLTGINNLREILKDISIKRRVGLYTRSAGGILGANVALDVPNNLASVILDRPFLDPFKRGILEENIEWGDLSDPEAVKAMRKWSPIEREIPKALPRLLINASPRDFVVPFEPIADFAKRIRASGSSDLFMLGISSNGSHNGGSVREICEERARINVALYYTLLDRSQ